MELEPLVLASIIKVVNEREEERQKLQEDYEKEADKKHKKTSKTDSNEPIAMKDPPKLTGAEFSQDKIDKTYEYIDKKLKESNDWIKDAGIMNQIQHAEYEQLLGDAW